MELKRHYRKPEGWQPEKNVRGADGKLKRPDRPEGELLNPPPIACLEVRHTGTSVEQKFMPERVVQGLAEGWITIVGDKLTLKTIDGQPDLVYTIKRTPGHYCCHCGEQLIDAAELMPQGGTRGMLHVATAHPATPSPDRGNPSGYLRLNAYDCVLDAEQHAQFRARRLGEAQEA